MTLVEIKRAVAGLSRQDLYEFREWFLRYDADAWDRQIEADVAAGRLDALAEEAVAEFDGDRTDLL